MCGVHDGEGAGEEGGELGRPAGPVQLHQLGHGGEKNLATDMKLLQYYTDGIVSSDYGVQSTLPTPGFTQAQVEAVSM